MVEDTNPNKHKGDFSLRKTITRRCVFTNQNFWRIYTLLTQEDAQSYLPNKTSHLLGVEEEWTHNVSWTRYNIPHDVPAVWKHQILWHSCMKVITFLQQVISSHLLNWNEVWETEFSSDTADIYYPRSCYYNATLTSLLSRDGVHLPTS